MHSDTPNPLPTNTLSAANADYATLAAEALWKIHGPGLGYPATDFTVGTMDQFRAILRAKGKRFLSHVVLTRDVAQGLTITGCTMAHRNAISQWPESDTTVYVIFPFSLIADVIGDLPSASDSIDLSTNLLPK